MTTGEGGNVEGRVHEARADTQVRPYGDMKAPGLCRGEPVCSPCSVVVLFRVDRTRTGTGACGTAPGRGCHYTGRGFVRHSGACR